MCLLCCVPLFMFTAVQLNAAARLVEAGAIRLPAIRVLPWSLEALKEGHVSLERADTVGKIVRAACVWCVYGGGCMCVWAWGGGGVWGAAWDFDACSPGLHTIVSTRILCLFFVLT